MLWEVRAGLMMELVSETVEQMTPLAEATVTTRCLAIFATPIRERTAMDRCSSKYKVCRHTVIVGLTIYS